jgi:hypothetical protein
MHTFSKKGKKSLFILRGGHFQYKSDILIAIGLSNNYRHIGITYCTYWTSSIGLAKLDF